MSPKRRLIVTADDFGIGPDTSRGILDLAAAGRVTSTVLLVNSPYAEHGVDAWDRAGRPVELGWHPCLTLDRPVLPAARVPSLVRPDGSFWPLGAFLRRLLTGRVRREDVAAELAAQYERFVELVGGPPPCVNSHHHVQVFGPVGEVLLEVLARRGPWPYVRRVCEPWRALARVPGGRGKRALLAVLGRRFARRQRQAGAPGNESLAGVTDPPFVRDPAFLARWLAHTPGRVVELSCHPGYLDRTLLGRDATPEDGQMERRVHELALLSHPDFLEASRRAELRLVSTAAAAAEGSAHAA